MSDQSNVMQSLRLSARTARRSMTAVERTRASRTITDRFLNSRHFLGSETLGCYVSTWEEVDTSAIIERAWRANKRVFLPVTTGSGGMRFCETLPETVLARNHFGLWEPLNSEEIGLRQLDVVVTPLVAFDDHGNRLGMGGGHFDRAFAFLRQRSHWLHPKLIGIAFECQRVEKISPNPWDIPVFRVLTETP